MGIDVVSPIDPPYEESVRRQIVVTLYQTRDGGAVEILPATPPPPGCGIKKIGKPGWPKKPEGAEPIPTGSEAV